MGGFTERQRREVAGRARTLHERLDGPPNDPGGEPAIDPERLLDEWRDRFPDGASFRDRLARDGLSEATVREHAAATRWPADEPLPDWVDDLGSLVRHVEATPAADDRAAVPVPDETAFAELLAAVADFARGRLPATVPADAASPMVEWLVARLEGRCVRALYVEFKSFVRHHDPELARADPAAFDDPPTAYYDRFVDAMFDGGFADLCVEYPVLARHLVRLVDLWVDAVVELCRRLRADRAALRDRFGVDGDATRLEPLADDAHAGGRIPVRVAFESGAVVYKPRPVDAGVALYEVLDRLDDRLPVPSFASPAYLSRDGYGWMEEVEHEEPADEAGVERYYERAAALLCVAYVLNLTDCQLENLVVAGEQPTVVDGETAFHPYVRPAASSNVTAVRAAVDRSVLLAGLLPWAGTHPRRQEEEDDAASVLAGFGSDSEPTRLAGRERPVVEAVNTDVMAVEAEPPVVERRTNTPTFDGEDRPPGEHVDALVRGFEAAHGTVRDLHADGRFLGDVADPELVGGVENRLLYRPTRQYGSVLRSSAGRDPLRDGVRFSVEFEALAAPFFDGRIEDDRYWPLYAAERRALRRLDVPRFSSRTDDGAAFHDGERLDVAADAAGYERCRRRLDAMDAADRRRQVWLLRRSVGADSLPSPPPSAAGPGDDRLLAAAVDLFEDAVDAAVDAPAGRHWVSIGGASSTVVMAPVAASLYRGRSGMALAAAALHDATGRDRYRRLVAELFDPVLDDLAADGRWFGLGGAMGVGSVVYALSVVADLLDESAYRERAAEAARTVTDARLADDDTFDVMEGAAGTLLGLLAYHDRYGGSGVLDRAVACGERLLDARVEVDGHRVWRTTDDVPITGFAHGTSGVAYALGRLGAAAGEPRFAGAARETLDFESTLYDPDRTNWAGSPAEDRYQDMWCHGRTGVALSRLGLGEHLGDDALLDEATAALAATARAEPSQVDHVCCGNLGRVEALLAGSRRAGVDPAHATELAGRCLARRERDGVLSLPGHSPSFVNPTFFDGVSGAAYSLLRLRDPGALPSAPLLE